MADLRWRGEHAQFNKPYQSTVAFEKFLDGHGCFRDGTEMLDIGCGLGATLVHFRGRHPGVSFLGVDYNPDKIAMGRAALQAKGIQGVSLAEGDWFNLPAGYIDRFDGIVNIQTLCCFKKIDDAIVSLCRMRPRWIAFNALFFEGNLDVLIHIRDYNLPHVTDDDPDADFNIFSLPRARSLFGTQGYRVVSSPFFPADPIPRRTDGGRGTYTMKSEFDDHTQFSGPVHLPWHFVLALRE